MDWTNLIQLAGVVITVLSFAIWLAYRFGRFEMTMLTIQDLISRAEGQNRTDHAEMKTRLEAHGSALDDHGERIATIEGARQQQQQHVAGG